MYISLLLSRFFISFSRLLYLCYPIVIVCYGAYRKSYLAHSRDSIVSISSIKPIQSLASQVTRRKVTTIKLRKHDAE